MHFELTDYQPYDFANRRHVGPSPKEMAAMLRVVGAESLDALIDERARTNDYIRALTLDEFAHTASTPGFGELTLMQWLRSFYRHDRMHTAQIEGRQSDYRPRYQGGREANQRQMRIDQVAARDTESNR